AGAAAGNYCLVVLVAYQGCAPLLFLKADRPHELKYVGASQSMNELNLYGSFVTFLFEMSLIEASSEMLDYVRNRAQRAYFYAKEGNPGPVQLNFPIREPLTPDLTLPALFGQPSMRQDKVTIGKKVLATEEINNFIDVLKNKQKPIIVC